MERLQELFDLSMQVFDLSTARGFYFLPFLAAAACLLLSENPQHKRLVKLLLIPTALGLLILLSPFAGSYAEGRDQVQIARFYWTLPLDLVTAYCLADALFRSKRAVAKGAVLAVLAVGVLASTRQYNTHIPKTDVGWPWEKADNLYKVPAAVDDICNIIRTKQGDAECRAAFPHDLAMYVRQYDAGIDMPYGFYADWKSAEYPCYWSINADEIDLTAVEQDALGDGLDYFVIDDTHIVGGELQDYAEIATVADGESVFGVYHRIATVG